MEIKALENLASRLSGTLHWDALHQTLYATDASVYRMLPLAVAYPRNEEDLGVLIRFAGEHGVGLIPRTAGTSLAGQCVGPGIVVDVSRHFTQILDLDVANRRVRVQPGVVRDELNRFLEPHGLFFGPNTSTSNRCMIGGMVGNNSSGTTSIRYGVTRDKVAGMRVLLSDASAVEIAGLTPQALEEKIGKNSLEASIYQNIIKELSDSDIQQEIKAEFPNPEIHRRNTGYAVDALLGAGVFSGNETPLDLAPLLCGSEGTLAFTTEITLILDELPPKHAAMVVPHYATLEQSLADVVPAMEHPLYLCEMMDKVILDCTKSNREQLENRFFVEGDPAALLMLEVRAHTPEALEDEIRGLQTTLKASGKSYAAPVLRGDDIRKAVDLRKAGLGLLGNMVGDKKAVACIEDTAVALKDLKDFIGEFSGIMDGYGQQAVYYAHAGAGELHLRPILDLKKTEDVKLFRAITTDVARLTKKYRGSFSGEHGDGIVRAEFIPLMIGQANYELLRRIKSYFDPKGIFNPGKIVDAFPMDRSLRYTPDREEPEIPTLMDFSDSMGILRAAEKCNGSGDCRKSHEMPGAMCPSYQATRREQDTTRGRANTLREVLTSGSGPNRFNREELKEVFDLCLSCKACARECPSNVDVATLKAEFSYQYQQANGYSWRNRLFAHNTKINAFNSRISGLVNPVLRSKALGGLAKRVFGVAPQRSLPQVARFDFDKALKKLQRQYPGGTRQVALFIDEFTRYLDVEQGCDALELLLRLGYDPQVFYAESGRTYISKGFLKQAQALALKNAPALKELADNDIPLLGLEPSAILTFRDEYKRMGLPAATAEAIASNCFLIEEFLAAEAEKGHFGTEHFTREPRVVKIHNHCYQKALSTQKVTFDLLNLPEHYQVSIIPSGCCGMAGSFGYEKEHYEVSMKVGGLRLFPAIRKAGQEVLLAANGTSCRHQIKDGTGRQARHPVSLLLEALES
ncbi:FAD-linked oxidase C-terminal domain-containing protein [Robiginitalea sp. M366]|uniref:FAD-binding and (Fe-S)-binding domain-containing protein n=1 Tax=Robiginitalea aestuariiviva TaxID=3036903 RepID=UPI00240E3C17|nr:FAD-binding and (Fe-S)-binding domain-containing protein [Robiginitalea aestuariiviva]MDG1572874.1 FAD-linked oxidase C-terminal domain-containing protein [Robiginitalea aestuariiviva]